MILRGEKVELRALEADDAALCHSLASASSSHLSTTPYWRPFRISDIEALIQLEESNSPSRIPLGITISDDAPTTEGARRLIGLAELDKISWIHGIAEIGLILWPDEKKQEGYGSDALKVLCHWAFTALRLRRLYAKTFSSNIGAQRCFEKNGFAVEGRWREHFFVQGEAEDAILYGCLQSNFFK